MTKRTQRSAVIPLQPGRWYLVIERSDRLSGMTVVETEHGQMNVYAKKERYRHWMTWAHCWGPFDNVTQALAQIKPYHPTVAILGTHVTREESIPTEGEWWPPLNVQRNLIGHAKPGYPLPTEPAKQPASIDFAAMEVECECGSTDLQLELLDVEAREFPDGPWSIKCNECGSMVDVYDAFTDGMDG